MGYKEDKITEEDYVQEYYKMMRASYRNNRERWGKIPNLEDIGF